MTDLVISKSNAADSAPLTCSSSHFVLLAKNVKGYTLDDVILFTSLCSLVR